MVCITPSSIVKVQYYKPKTPSNASLHFLSVLPSFRCGSNPLAPFFHLEALALAFLLVPALGRPRRRRVVPQDSPAAEEHGLQLPPLAAPHAQRDAERRGCSRAEPPHQVAWQGAAVEDGEEQVEALDGEGEVEDELGAGYQEYDGYGPVESASAFVASRKRGGSPYMMKPPLRSQTNATTHPCVVSPRTLSQPSIKSAPKGVPDTSVVKRKRIRLAR